MLRMTNRRRSMLSGFVIVKPVAAVCVAAAVDGGFITGAFFIESRERYSKMSTKSKWELTSEETRHLRQGFTDKPESYDGM